jgi:hypothetical protein
MAFCDKIMHLTFISFSCTLGVILSFDLYMVTVRCDWY